MAAGGKGRRSPTRIDCRRSARDDRPAASLSRDRAPGRHAPITLGFSNPAPLATTLGLIPLELRFIVD